MKKLFIILLFSLPTNFIYANPNYLILSDSAAIVQTALDYGDGFYSGDATRMEKALHPDFNKVSPMKLSESGNTILYYSTFSGLIEMTRAKVGFIEEDARKIRVTVFKIDGDIAFAKIMTAMFNDYLEMVKINEQWKIINVLWTNGEDSPNKVPLKDFKPDNEKGTILSTVNDYYEGIYTGNAAKIDASVHTEYNSITLVKLPNNSVILNKDGFTLIREVAQSKMRLLDKDKWNLQITILDIMDGLAAVEVNLTSGINYMQLAKMDGQWKIINSLKKSLK
jgi:hypothetical protein